MTKKIFKSPLFWIIAIIVVAVGGFYLYKELTKDSSAANTGAGGSSTTFKDIDSETDPVLKEFTKGKKVKELQQKIKTLDPAINLGTGGPNGDGVDELFGDATKKGLMTLKAPDSNGQNKQTGRTEIKYSQISMLEKA